MTSSEGQILLIAVKPKPFIGSIDKKKKAILSVSWISPCFGVIFSGTRYSDEPEFWELCFLSM